MRWKDPSPQRATTAHNSTNPRRLSVKNPLDSLSGTIICGFILTAILWYVAKLIVSHAMGTGA
jgi:hypothetical protein